MNAYRVVIKNAHDQSQINELFVHAESLGKVQKWAFDQSCLSDHIEDYVVCSELLYNLDKAHVISV